MARDASQLTAKQEAFCIAFIKTGDPQEAYRQAYDCKNSSKETIRKRSQETMSKGAIKGRIAEIRQPVVEEAQLTLKQHLYDLKRLRDISESAGKFGPAITAEMARGKVSGLYVDKIEHSGNITIQASPADEKI